MTLPAPVRRRTAGWLLALLATTAWAQSYPERPLRIVVPYAAGGGTDQSARLIAEKLAVRLKQPVVVENRAGANGSLGADFVARAPADGYTLLFAGMGPLAVNPSLYKRLPYVPTQAFAPIVQVASTPLVLVAGPAASADSLPSLIAQARQEAGRLTAANAGDGSPQHVCAALWSRAADATLSHVPYKGSAPAITDLLGGNVATLCENLGTIRPFITSGKVRPLAVSTRQRSDLLPGTATFAEQGLPDIDLRLWFMLVAPAATPAPVVERLNREVNAILALPEVTARLHETANHPVGGSVQAATEHLAAENRRWPDLLKSMGLESR